MVDKYRNINKSARIRTFIFTIILLGCSILAVYLSMVVSEDNPMYTPLDTENVSEVNIDGADFSPLITLMGYGINGILSVLTLVVIFAYLLFETVIVSVPIVILRLIGLRRKNQLCSEEYALAKNVYFLMIVLSLTVSLLVSRFVAVLPVMLFTIDWSLMMLIYVTGLKKRCISPQHHT